MTRVPCVTLVIAAFALGCSFEWDSHDPRVTGSGGAIAVGGAGGSGGAGGEGGNQGGATAVTTVISGLQPVRIVVDATHAYVTSHDQGGAITRAPKDGGAAETLVTGQAEPRGIAVDDNHVYWVTRGGAVRQLDKAGGNEVILFDETVTTELLDVGVNTTTVYWSDNENDRISRIPIDGGTESTLSTSQQNIRMIFVDGVDVFWVNDGPGDVVVSENHGVPTVLGTTGNGATDVVADATHVYWTSNFQGTVQRVLRSGGSMEELANNQTGVTTLAIDDTHVYWLAKDDGAIMRATLSGDQPTEFVSGLSNPASVVVDATHVYWINIDEGAVVRRLK